MNIKAFKVCRICMDNLQYTNLKSYNLMAINNIKHCPLNPTCYGQPERTEPIEKD